MDPFATLGIERRYDVDLGALERTHRELSRAIHPDRYVGSTAGEKREALTRAVEVNEAWRIVRNPLRRAEALLSLHGVAVGEDREPSPEPEFLLEILEQREALSEARGARDRRAVHRLADAVRTRSRHTERELSAGLATRPDASLVGTLGKLRFYQRFLDEVDAIEDELV
ncbi:MAG TPA: Fe-S protein assembly co-chaperone HscB [Polyangiaceae bacterium]|nr:Fe-S protein assembly co-chaperone HscB [Polyangiaceae bacterium]